MMKKAILLLAVTAATCSAWARSYVFTYFDTKKESAGLCIAYSRDGYHWTAVNDNQPVMKPTVGKDKLLRDPSVCQAPDGTFHLVWTSSWNDRIIGYSSSTDLIHWGEQKAIPVMKDYPTARNSWAPELYYDAPSGLYYIYWASTVPGAKGVQTKGCLSEHDYNHRIYCCTTKDFQTFSKTQLYYNPDFNAIDASIVRDPETGELLMAVKNENLNPREKNIRIARGKSMKKGFSHKVSDPIHGNDWCEGPAPLFVSDGLLVYYDMYGRHRFGASLSKDHGRTWEDATQRISVPQGMSHGTAIAVDDAVVDSLIAWDEARKQPATFTFGTKTNPDGVTFEVDSRGFLVGGKRVLPVMGEIHYSRVPRADWQREIRKMKAGGITVISTYVFWIHHEAEEGQWDWSDNKDLRAFLQTCKEEGLPVVIRIGPFCHGEVYQGGFPEWIVNKSIADAKQYRLRSTAPGFLDAVDSLYQHIGEQTRGLLWKDGGPVVGVQIENECHGPWKYLMALRERAIKAGLDVPFMTRTGWPKLSDKEEFGRLLPLYGDYADGFWDRSMADMPGQYPQAFEMKNTRLSSVIATEALGTNQDTRMTGKDLQYPYLTCELGGGMMPSYHRRINISGDEAFPLAICKLGSGSNLPGYYMYHGGANAYNPQHSMAEMQATPVTNYNDLPYITYDFQAPLGEMGQMNARSFHQTRWLHQFLSDWGEELSAMDVDTLFAHYARRGCFEFRNTYVRILNEEGVTSVTPVGLKWEELTITSHSVQPFAKADGGIYFIPVKGETTFEIDVNGTSYTLTPDVPQTILGKTFTLLSYARAEQAFVIDGKMHYSQHDGILYRDGNRLTEEWWETIEGKRQPQAKLTRKAGPLREVKMGSQKAAEQPSNEDFDKAACYRITLNLPNGIPADSLFLQINYQGDVARVYADGQLVEDNFWNGKPMLVRASALVGKQIELRILPLGKDYPIYLQREQREALQNARGESLVGVQGLSLLRCRHD